MSIPAQSKTVRDCAAAEFSAWLTRRCGCQVTVVIRSDASDPFNERVRLLLDLGEFVGLEKLADRLDGIFTELGELVTK